MYFNASSYELNANLVFLLIPLRAEAFTLVAAAVTVGFLSCFFLPAASDFDLVTIAAALGGGERGGDELGLFQ